MKNRINIYISVMLVAALFAFSVTAQERKLYIADRIIAVVGDQMILQSHLSMAQEYYKYQNRIPGSDPLSEEETADILSQMLLMKLLATQARIDSLSVSGYDYDLDIDQRVSEMIEQYGSQQAVEKLYGKPMFLIREDIRLQVEDNVLSSQMRSKVVQGVSVTPNEVEKLVRKLDPVDIPLIPTQYSYSQIVKRAPSTPETKMAIKERLLGFRERILAGDNFAALARMYSDDAASAVNGGDLGYAVPATFVSEFADALVSLKIGQISNVIETEYGQHIIQLVDKRDDKYRARHILLREKFSVGELAKATAQLDSISKAINSGSATFADMAKKSDDKDSRVNGGRVINSTREQYMGLRYKSDRFFIDELGKDYNFMRDLNPGVVSAPFQSNDDSGNVICKIVMVDAVYPEHRANVRDDYTTMVDIVIGQRRQEVFDKWVNEKIKTLYIRLEEPYRSYDFENYNWVK